MENVYVNKVGIPQSLDGEHEWQVETLDFDTSCPCQITACDGGTINVCAKVRFKKGFIFDGDICDLDGGATFKEFNTPEGYYVEHSSSTCENPVAKTRAVAFASDATVNPPVLSTVYQAKTSSTTAEGAKVKINNTESQPTTNPGGTLQCGVLIEGGTVSNVKSIRVQTGDATDATIWNRSRGDQTFSTGVFHPGTFEGGFELTDKDLYGNTLPNPQRIIAPKGGLPTNPFPNPTYSGTYLNLGYKNGEQIYKLWTAQMNLMRATSGPSDSNSKPAPTTAIGAPGDTEGDIRWQTFNSGGSGLTAYTELYICFRDYIGGISRCWTKVQLNVW